MIDGIFAFCLKQPGNDKTCYVKLLASL